MHSSSVSTPGTSRPTGTSTYFISVLAFLFSISVLALFSHSRALSPRNLESAAKFLPAQAGIFEED
jgi:uncharacterized membrane protein